MTKPEETENIEFEGLGDIKALLQQIQKQETGMAVIDEKLDKVNELMKQLESELQELSKSKNAGPIAQK
ncbi:hypothetical protein QEN19_003644 [Hanseniaspora menglaensis]